MQEHTSIAESMQEHTSIAKSGQEHTSIAKSMQEHTSIAKSGQEHTSIAISIDDPFVQLSCQSYQRQCASVFPYYYSQISIPWYICNHSPSSHLPTCHISGTHSQLFILLHSSSFRPSSLARVTSQKSQTQFNILNFPLHFISSFPGHLLSQGYIKEVTHITPCSLSCSSPFYSKVTYAIFLGQGYISKVIYHSGVLNSICI